MIIQVPFCFMNHTNECELSFGMSYLAIEKMKNNGILQMWKECSNKYFTTSAEQLFLTLFFLHQFLCFVQGIGIKKLCYNFKI